MSLKRKPYFSSSILKRYLVQVLSCFSGYQVKTGIQRDGVAHFIDVPVMYGDSSKVAGYLISGGENSMASLPTMSVYMTGLDRAEEYRKAAQHTEKYSFIERARDGNGDLIINQPGKKKIIEMYMPNPYRMEFDLAIWASNNDQLYQLLEQILTVFDPEMDIQISNSPADWTFLTTMFLGDIKFEKAIPEGTNPDPLYVATISFSMIIWMGPPTKVYDAKTIREIVVDIRQLEAGIDFDSMQELDMLIIRPTAEEILEDENLENN